MGANITLGGSGFKTAAWCREAAQWLQEETDQVLSQLCLQLSYETLPELEKGPLEDELWLHPVGGIRGLTLRFFDSTVDLSLPTGSGEADWRLAAKFATFGARQGAQIHCDEEPVKPGPAGLVDLTSQFQRQWDFETSAIIQSLGQSDGATQLPVGGIIYLSIDAPLASDPNFHDRLVEKMARYSSAFLASNMVFEKDGQQFTFNVAGAIPVLVSSGTHMIAARSEAEVAAGGFKHHLPAARFFEIMGSRAENLGPLIYVPAIDPVQDADLITEILAVESAIPEGRQPSEPDSNTGLSAEEQELLDRSPIIIFLLVAAADGNIDRKELESFRKVLHSLTDLPPSMFKGILLRCLNEIQRHFSEIMSAPLNPLTLMVEIPSISAAIAKCPAEEQPAIREGLYRLAHKIASASGGFLGFGSKISKGERASLKLLASLLEVEPKSIGLS
ncbi:hypothetical protein ACFQY0_18890 [Haloferula chungangensis]|uniref:Uncharacterized protein n=1 Tax=Haloferula chungangensis TaxID=1048331 RepID=A0ABW2LA45_9BACT